MKPAGFAGKAVLVTGGSRGIGRAIVDALRRRGRRRDVLLSRQRARRRRTLSRLRARPAMKCTAQQVDVTRRRRRARPRSSGRRARRAHRRAGEQRRRDPRQSARGDSTTTTSRAVLDTNVGGVFNMARAVVPYMIMQRAGRDRQPELGGRREGRPRPDELRGEQGRDQRVHARARRRARAAQDHA